jgi:hypothetical protein
MTGSPPKQFEVGRWLPARDLFYSRERPRVAKLFINPIVNRVSRR